MTWWKLGTKGERRGGQLRRLLSSEPIVRGRSWACATTDPGLAGLPSSPGRRRPFADRRIRGDGVQARRSSRSGKEQGDPGRRRDGRQYLRDQADVPGARRTGSIIRYPGQGQRADDFEEDRAGERRRGVRPTRPRMARPRPPRPTPNASPAAPPRAAQGRPCRSNEAAISIGSSGIAVVDARGERGRGRRRPRPRPPHPAAGPGRRCRTRGGGPVRESPGEAQDAARRRRPSAPAASRRVPDLGRRPAAVRPGARNVWPMKGLAVPFALNRSIVASISSQEARAADGPGPDGPERGSARSRRGIGDFGSADGEQACSFRGTASSAGRG